MLRSLFGGMAVGALIGAAVFGVTLRPTLMDLAAVFALLAIAWRPE